MKESNRLFKRLPYPKSQSHSKNNPQDSGNLGDSPISTENNNHPNILLTEISPIIDLLEFHAIALVGGYGF